MSVKEFFKSIPGWIIGAVIAIGAVFAYLFSIRNNNNRGRIQRDKQCIRNGSIRTKESQSINTAAQEHANSAGKSIDSAIDSLADAQSILKNAKKRTKK